MISIQDHRITSEIVKSCKRDLLLRQISKDIVQGLTFSLAVLIFVALVQRATLFPIQLSINMRPRHPRSDDSICVGRAESDVPFSPGQSGCSVLHIPLPGRLSSLGYHRSSPSQTLQKCALQQIKDQDFSSIWIDHHTFFGLGIRLVACCICRGCFTQRTFFHPINESGACTSED